MSVCILRRLIEEEQVPTMERSHDFGFGWNRYNDLNAIYKWLDQLLEKYPNVLTNYVYGKSYEGRPLRAVKVSHKKVLASYTHTRKCFLC